MLDLLRNHKDRFSHDVAAQLCITIITVYIIMKAHSVLKYMSKTEKMGSHCIVSKISYCV